MPDPVTAIRNVGPAMAEGLARAGITTARQLRRLGADVAYRRLIETGHPPHFIGYYALVMGLQGRPWNDARGSEKAALRERFDTIKAAAAPARAPAGAADGLEAILDEIGVVRRPAHPSGPARRERRGQPTSSSPEKK